MFAFSHRVAIVLSFASLVACSQSVEGQAPPARTGSAQTAQGSQETDRGTQTESGTTSSQTTSSKSQACPEIDVPACAATDELVTGVDEEGCSYAYCKPNGCPPVDVPQCEPGQGLKYTTDENGCMFADCE